jgi:hypothetical protein
MTHYLHLRHAKRNNKYGIFYRDLEEILTERGGELDL